MLEKPSSSITFMYFNDFSRAVEFFTSVLGLEQVMDQGWAVIWKTGESGFLGAVDVTKGSIPVTSRGGVLISLNVTDVSAWHQRIGSAGVEDLTPIKDNDQIGLRSFFFRGPEGYNFEIQEFLKQRDRKVFLG